MQGKKEHEAAVPAGIEGIGWQAGAMPSEDGNAAGKDAEYAAAHGQEEEGMGYAAAHGQEEGSGRISVQEQKIREIQKFNLFSDTFMSVALEDISTCQYVLRILAGDRRLRLCRVKSQYTISRLASHNAWLDVLAEDTRGRLYALEVQRRDTGNHPRRVRFYGSMVDSSFLLKGEDYDRLPEVRLFYIGAGDFLKSGGTLAEVEKRLRVAGRDNLTYEDGLRVTYINAGVEDDTEISRLMRYFKTADPEDMGHGELSKRVRFLKKEEEGIRIMCEVTEQFWKWGYESGKEEGERQGERRGIRKGERRGECRGIRKGERRGIRKGERRGIRKGERRGMQKQAWQTARNLALMGIPVETIAKAVEEEIPVVERWLQEI